MIHYVEEWNLDGVHYHKTVMSKPLQESGLVQRITKVQATGPWTPLSLWVPPVVDGFRRVETRVAQRLPTSSITVVYTDVEVAQCDEPDEPTYVGDL